MSMEQTKQDLDYLVQNLICSVEKRPLLRSTLEASLMRLGHERDDIVAVVDKFYERNLH